MTSSPRSAVNGEPDARRSGPRIGRRSRGTAAAPPYRFGHARSTRRVPGT